MGCGKQRKSTAPVQSLVKLRPWFLSLWWKTCLQQNCSLGSCACSEGPALGQNTLMMILRWLIFSHSFVYSATHLFTLFNVYMNNFSYSLIYFFTCSFFFFCGLDSSSDKALGYRLYGPGSIPGVEGVDIFLHSFVFRLVQGSTQPPIKWVPSASPGGKGGRA